MQCSIFAPYTVLKRPLMDRSTTAVIGICTAFGQPAVDDRWQTKSKLPRVLQLESSQLSVTDAHFTITHRAGSS